MEITLSIIAVFLVVIFAFYMFVKEVFPIDVTAMIVMVILMLLRVIDPGQAISGFAQPAVFTNSSYVCISVLGLKKTGILNIITVRAFGWVGSNIILQLIFIMGISAAASSLLVNSAVVAILLPFVTNLTKLSKTSPRKIADSSFLYLYVGGHAYFSWYKHQSYYKLNPSKFWT